MTRQFESPDQAGPRLLHGTFQASHERGHENGAGELSKCRGLRSERALTIAMAEMYVQGVSTRKVNNILEKMCGLEVSFTQVSDAARKAVFPAVPWQRCYFHLCQNAQAYARKIEEKKEIARTMRNIFSHDSKEDALMALRSAVQYWAETKKNPKFAGWLENNAEESMTYFNFNEGWWRLPESRIVQIA